jgi:F-type H+-transporting ATPase subunit epsilon
MFELKILTPKKRVFSGQVTSLVAPGELGYLGILSNHAPLVTTLVPGKVTFRDPSGGAPRVMQSVGEGLLEVQKNQAVLLLDDVREGAR